MLTAEQIAKETNLVIYQVRYRLGELRREGRIKATLYGNTYVYPPSTVKKVQNFEERK